MRHVALLLIRMIWNELLPCKELRGVIVFTDPDYNGERIRKIIMQEVPQAKHAFLNRGEAVPKSRPGAFLGVEHTSFEDLEKP